VYDDRGFKLREMIINKEWKSRDMIKVSMRENYIPN